MSYYRLGGTYPRGSTRGGYPDQARKRRLETRTRAVPLILIQVTRYIDFETVIVVSSSLIGSVSAAKDITARSSGEGRVAPGITIGRDSSAWSGELPVTVARPDVRRGLSAKLAGHASCRPVLSASRITVIEIEVVSSLVGGISAGRGLVGSAEGDLVAAARPSVGRGLVGYSIGEGRGVGLLGLLQVRRRWGGSVEVGITWGGSAAAQRYGGSVSIKEAWGGSVEVVVWSGSVTVSEVWGGSVGWNNG